GGMGIARLAYVLEIGRRFKNSMPPNFDPAFLWFLRGPALLRQRDEFRPIFKMHAVDVEPFGAPDEPMALEYLTDRARHAIAPRKSAGAASQRFPIVCLPLIDVDRCCERMH